MSVKKQETLRYKRKEALREKIRKTKEDVEAIEAGKSKTKSGKTQRSTSSKVAEFNCNCIENKRTAVGGNSRMDKAPVCNIAVFGAMTLLIRGWLIGALKVQRRFWFGSRYRER